MGYVKGGVFRFWHELNAWVKSGEPYYVDDFFHNTQNDYYYVRGEKNGESIDSYFRAIPKPEKKKLYAYYENFIDGKHANPYIIYNEELIDSEDRAPEFDLEFGSE